MWDGRGVRTLYMEDAMASAGAGGVQCAGRQGWYRGREGEVMEVGQRRLCTEFVLPANESRRPAGSLCRSPTTSDTWLTLSQTPISRSIHRFLPALAIPPACPYPEAGTLLAALARHDSSHGRRLPRILAETRTAPARNVFSALPLLCPLRSSLKRLDLPQLVSTSSSRGRRMSNPISTSPTLRIATLCTIDAFSIFMLVAPQSSCRCRVLLRQLLDPQSCSRPASVPTAPTKQPVL